MTIAKIRENIVLLKKKLDSVEKHSSEKLKNAPSAVLFVQCSKKGARYYKRAPAKYSKRVYLGSGQEQQIKALEEKNYYERLKKATSAEKVKLAEVEKMLSAIQDVDSVFFDIPENKRHLIEPYLILQDDHVPFKEESRSFNSSYKTLDNEKVRSKSELIIADRLKFYNVPYSYEPPVLMNDTSYLWYPDFFVYNKRTRKGYYWEHFGMLDDPKYRESFQGKLEEYANVGIFPGENLIITTESTSHTLNTDYINKIIEHYLI